MLSLLCSQKLSGALLEAPEEQRGLGGWLGLGYEAAGLTGCELPSPGGRAAPGDLCGAWGSFLGL